jgi:hypothetical protein
MYKAAASCKDATLTPVTNWVPQCVTLAGYCYAVRHSMNVQPVTPYRVSHLQRYGVTVLGNVTSVYPPSASVPCALMRMLWHVVNLSLVFVVCMG